MINPRHGMWAFVVVSVLAGQAFGGVALQQSSTDQPSPAVPAAVDPGLVTAPAPSAQPHSAPGGDFAGSAPRSRENYRIGPGDVLEIRVLGEDKMTSTVKVTGDGFVRFPYIDEDIAVQCLTEREMGTLLADKLKRFLKYPEVFVTVKEFNSSPVAIMGAVNTPGRFQMQRKVRLIELLTFAGGVKNESGRTLTIIHVDSALSCDPDTGAPVSSDESATAESVNVKQLMDGDPAADRVMRPGDIVILPVADMVFIAGEVLKPNAYALREGMTLSQALALAGGPSGIAKLDGIRIVRQEPGKSKVEIPVDFKLIQTNQAEDPLLFANDVVEIPGSTGKKFMRGFLSAIGGSAGSLPLRAVP